jgi:ADP-ribose pyrophosphatase YjhB (NUDIX family)
VYDPVADRLPGLLDAGPRVLAAGRAPRDAADRSRAFFDTLPRKVVAAATLTRDPAGRVLIVHDSFRCHWTIPGGVVDADEDPRAAAERETHEESGVRVTATGLLGVFSGSWPDRLVLVYAAAPVATGTPAPRPVHAHEVDDAAWVGLDEALRRINPVTRAQLRRCLDEPGGTWRD